MKFDRFDGISVVALVLTFVLVAAAPFGPKALGDLDFHKQGKRLAAAVKGSGPVSEVEFRKAPGPILYYFIPYLAVPVDAPDRVYWRAGVIWTGLWMVVALVLVRRVATRLGGENAGRAAVALALLSPFSVYYSLGILAEGPAYVSVALLLYGWVRWSEERAARWPPVLMVVGLVFLILCRPNTALVPVIALAAAWTLRRRDRGTARVTAAVAVTALLMFLLTGALLSLLHGGPARSRQAGYFWDITLQGRFQFRTEPFDWRFWDSDTRRGSLDFSAFAERDAEIRREALARGVPVGPLMRSWVLEDTVRHPFLTAKMALVRVASMHVSLVNSKPPSAFAVGPIPGWAVYWTFHTFVNVIGLSISALALYFLWGSRGNLASIWPLWAPWLALVLFHAIVYAEPRYLLPAKYCQIVMAGCVLASLFERAPRATTGKV